MDEQQNTNLVMDATFDDLDDLSESIRGYRLDFTQLDTGVFHAAVRQWIDGPVLFGYARIDRMIHQRGETPPGLITFGVPATNSFDVTWRGAQVDADHLLIFPEDGEIESVSSPGFEVFTVSIPAENAEAVDRLCGGRLDMLTSRRGQAWRCDPGAMTKLRRELHRALRDSLENADSAGTVIDLAINALHPGAKPVETPNGAPSSREIFSAAVQIIDRALTEDIVLSGVAQDAGVGESELRDIIAKEAGVDAAQLIKTRRLSKARSELRRIPPERGAVADIAKRYRYTSSAQFAADYKAMFDELPSDTLDRLPRRV